MVSPQPSRTSVAVAERRMEEGLELNGQEVGKKWRACIGVFGLVV